jgi:hypothetical protein
MKTLIERGITLLQPWREGTHLHIESTVEYKVEVDVDALNVLVKRAWASKHGVSKCGPFRVVVIEEKKESVK